MKSSCLLYISSYLAKTPVKVLWISLKRSLTCESLTSIWSAGHLNSWSSLKQFNTQDFMSVRYVVLRLLTARDNEKINDLMWLSDGAFIPMKYEPRIRHNGWVKMYMTTERIIRLLMHSTKAITFDHVFCSWKVGMLQ